MPSLFHPRRNAGFGLVEIMVGMVIGMLGIIVMMQVFALSEERKRTATSGGDAITEGTMALYAVQRDLRQAGYGIADTKLLGCNVLLRTGVTLVAMAPVTIYPSGTGSPRIPAGDANSDTLLVVYGNTSGSPQGDGITSQPAVTQYAVQAATSFVANDWVLAAPPTRSCATTASPLTPALTLDRVTASSVPNVSVATGASGMASGTLFNLGQTPKIVAYAVRSGNLTACDYTVNDCSVAASTSDPSIWVPVANNIVSLRAQYGRDTDTPMDGVVDTFDQTTPTTTCAWAKVSAVRIALVARSAQTEKTAVTTTAPTWEGSAAAPIVLSGNSTWQNYRYKVFQTVAPLRNVAWLGAVTGC